MLPRLAIELDLEADPLEYWDCTLERGRGIVEIISAISGLFTLAWV